MNKSIFKNIKHFVVVFAIVFAAALSIQMLNGTTASAAAKLNKTKLTVCKGQTYQLKVSGTKTKVKWKTSNKSIASVSSTGKIKALKAANVLITATVGKTKLYCNVKIENPKFEKSKYSTNPGEKYTLKFGKTTQKITWKTSNKNIVAISGAKYNKFNCYGTITATVKGTGTATVTAKVGSKTFKCTFSSAKTGSAAIVIEKKYTSKYGIALKVKNNNTYAASFFIKISLLDANKKTIGTVETSTNCLGANKSAMLPVCTNYASKKLSSYNYSYTKTQITNFSKSTYKDMSPYVTIAKSGFDTASGMTSYPKIKMTTTKSLFGGIFGTVLFFDKNGKFLCASTCSSRNSMDANTSDTVSLDDATLPHDLIVNPNLTYPGVLPKNVQFDSSKTQVYLRGAFSDR